MRLSVTLNVQCLSVSTTVALLRTNPFRRFLVTRISVKVYTAHGTRHTAHVQLVSKSIRYDALHIVKVQLAGRTADVMDKLTVFKTLVL